MSIEQAFHEICVQAKTPQAFYVSLYCQSRVYGGPEEGGWWRSITQLKAYEHCQTEEEAKAKMAKVVDLTNQLNKDAIRSHGQMCQNQLESCNWDGEIAQAVFGEVNGPDKFFVIVEKQLGSRNYADLAHYE